VAEVTDDEFDNEFPGESSADDDAAFRGGQVRGEGRSSVILRRLFGLGRRLSLYDAFLLFEG